MAFLKYTNVVGLLLVSSMAVAGPSLQNTKRKQRQVASVECPTEKQNSVTEIFCGTYLSGKTGDTVTDNCYNPGALLDSAAYSRIWNILYAADAALVLNRPGATRDDLTNAINLDEVCLCVSGTAIKGRAGEYNFDRVSDVLTCGTSSRPRPSTSLSRP